MVSAQRAKKSKNYDNFISTIKKIGIVLAPILVVATIAEKLYPAYTKRAVVITIVLLYVIWIEMRIKKLEEKCKI